MAKSKLPKWAIRKAGGINKKAWRLARRGRKNKRSSPARKKSRSKSSRVRRMKRMPHPSITGLVSGALVLKAINRGDHQASGTTDVLAALKAGNVEQGINNLLHNIPELVTTSSGQKTLLTSIGIAAGGAWVRKTLPNVKLGGSKIFARI